MSDNEEQKYGLWVAILLIIIFDVAVYLLACELELI